MQFLSRRSDETGHIFGYLIIVLKRRVLRKLIREVLANEHIRFDRPKIATLVLNSAFPVVDKSKFHGNSPELFNGMKFKSKGHATPPRVCTVWWPVNSYNSKKADQNVKGDLPVYIFSYVWPMVTHLN